MSGRAWILGFVVGVVVAVAPSCGGSTCNAMNCSTGCCDAMGQCQPGTTPSACGKGGAACGACAPGQACTLQICGGPMGGGSSGTGGGFSSGGGSGGGSAGGSAMDAGCMEYGDIDLNDTFPAGFNVGEPDSGLEGFEWWDVYVPLEGATPAKTDTFVGELYFETVDGPPTFPYAGTLATNTTYSNCSACFWASIGCDDNGENCDGEYLATSGSYNFTAGTRRADAGVFNGEGTNLTFRRWNFETDRPNGTACFTVGTFRFRGLWPDPPEDGGTVDGGTVDSGTVDSGTVDSGTVDSGTVDGGTVDSGTVDSGTVDSGTRDGG